MVSTTSPLPHPTDRYVDQGDGGFGAGHKVIRWFWEWAMSLGESDRRKLLLFWSGSSRVPPFGFEDDALNEDHRWAIGRGPVVDACPHASTWWVNKRASGRLCLPS